MDNVHDQKELVDTKGEVFDAFSKKQRQQLWWYQSEHISLYLQVIEEKVGVCQLKDQLLHL